MLTQQLLQQQQQQQLLQQQQQQAKAGVPGEQPDAFGLQLNGQPLQVAQPDAQAQLQAAAEQPQQQVESKA
jgi:type II secretory pathway pseudopilin PulG